MSRERIQFTTYWFMFRIFISFLTYFDILYFLRDVCIFCKFSIWLVFLLFRWFFSWLFLSYCIFYLHFLLYTHPNFLPCLSFHFSLPPYCFLSLWSSVPEISFLFSHSLISALSYYFLPYCFFRFALFLFILISLDECFTHLFCKASICIIVSFLIGFLWMISRRMFLRFLINISGLFSRRPWQLTALLESVHLDSVSVSWDFSLWSTFGMWYEVKG